MKWTAKKRKAQTCRSTRNLRDSETQRIHLQNFDLTTQTWSSDRHCRLMMRNKSWCNGMTWWFPVCFILFTLWCSFFRKSTMQLWLTVPKHSSTTTSTQKPYSVERKPVKLRMTSCSVWKVSLNQLKNISVQKSDHLVVAFWNLQKWRWAFLSMCVACHGLVMYLRQLSIVDRCDSCVHSGKLRKPAVLVDGRQSTQGTGQNESKRSLQSEWHLVPALMSGQYLEAFFVTCTFREP